MNLFNKLIVKAMIAGIACLKKMLLLAVIALYNPATMTQLRKNALTLNDQFGSEIKNDQINPAAKNPLYKPWLAAKPFVGLNNSSGSALLKVFFPKVSQANISMYRM